MRGVEVAAEGAGGGSSAVSDVKLDARAEIWSNFSRAQKEFRVALSL